MSRQRIVLSLLKVLVVYFWSATAVAQSLQPVVFTIESGSTLSVDYAGSQGQGFLGAGATSPVQGHFLVEFDPLTSSPSTIDFQLGHGFLDAQVTGNWLPGTGGVGLGAPADLGITNGELYNAVRNLVWDWTSSPVANNGDNTFNASSTSFEVLSMLDVTNVYGEINQTGTSDNLSTGSWNLTQLPDGWDLRLSGTYTDSILRTWTFDVRTSAAFTFENVDVVTPDPATGVASAEALGGIDGAEPGGVEVDFAGVPEDATFSAQQLPNSTSFSQGAIEALDGNSLFALTTGDPAVQDQIWDLSLVDAQGDSVLFDTALVQIQYDDSSFAPGFDEQQLGLWHFNSQLGEWETFTILDGTTTVDPVNNVITAQLTSFSELQLGVFVVPEPSTLFLSAMGVICLAGCALRRRNAVNR